MALTKATNRMIDGSAINVQDYGAVGDGVADDTSAIQAAFDAGSNIYFPVGTYKVSSTLVITSDNTTINGTRSSIIKSTIDNGDPTILVAKDGLSFGASNNYVQGFVLNGLRIEGEDTGGVSTNWNNTVFLKLYSVTQWFISNLVTFRSLTSHVELYGCYQGTMQQCQLEKSNSYLLYANKSFGDNGSNLVTFDQVTFSDSVGNAIYFRKGYSVTMKSCELHLGSGYVGTIGVQLFDVTDFAFDTVHWDGGDYSTAAIVIGVFNDGSSLCDGVHFRNCYINNAQNASATEVMIFYNASNSSFVSCRVLGSASQTPVDNSHTATSSGNNEISYSDTLLFNGGNLVIESNSFGESLDYSNVTASRTTGVTYTNATAKPLFVSVSYRMDAAFVRAIAVVNGNNAAQTGNDTSTDVWYGNLSFIVPPAQTYLINSVGAGSMTLNSWYELV